VEDRAWRWIAVTAIAPVAWGAAYFITRQLLPPDAPLWGAALRALPAGLLLLALARRRPRGDQWWRAAVLGSLTTGVFFVLVYLAGQLLPTSIAAVVMATSPVVMMSFAWALLAERPRPLALVGAAIGLGGVALLLLGGTGEPVPPLGVVVSLAAMVVSAAGFVLAKRWTAGVDLVATTSWQLIAGGVLLLPVAIAVEGAPPPLTVSTAVGFGYLSVVAGAVAFVAWFAGLRRLDAGTVGLVGLLNPVTGVLLGTAIAGEVLLPRQLAGLALVLAGVVLGVPAGTALLRRRGRRSAPAAATPPGTVAR
jgi:probable blue pigment (indigoidine) exporter